MEPTASTTDGARTLADDVLDGLTRPFKELSPKHLYDERGSALFERITELPEYYPTRAERGILSERAEHIAREAGASELVELGSGSASKTRVLLDTGAIRRYVPFDVSAATVAALEAELPAEYPGLEVVGVVGDFDRDLHRIPPGARDGRLLAFLGGTIGNFTPGARRAFLRSLAGVLGDDGTLLLGTDLVKDPRIIEAAYDDSQGVTAEFNRNLLHVLNRELDADFPVEEFEHVAFYDRRHEWVEMRLRARRACRVHLRRLDLTVHFERGEELRTEISAKFTRERVEADLRAAGLRLVDWLTDERGWFALSLARPA